MTQQTPNNKVSSPQSQGASKMPAIAINENTGTVNVYVGDSYANQDAKDVSNPIRGFIAPDASSEKLNQQIAAMQTLGLIPDTTTMAMDSARQDANIQMPIPSTVGKFTQQLQDQQMEALSQAPEGPAQG